MSSEKFCLRWNDFERNISAAFRDIREDKEFFDITIACEDEQLQAHKVILSACSPFFKNVLRRNQHQHPLLYLKGVSYRDMEAVLNFMYHGEVNVAQDDLNSFLQVAEDLRVKGLTQNNSGTAIDTSKTTTSVPKTEPRIEPHTPRVPDPTPIGAKRPRPSPSVSRILPKPVAEQDDDIEEIVPIVKSEPREPTPAVMTTTPTLVVQQQSMTMYEDESQMMTTMDTEQYDDSYAEYDEQYAEQGYENSMVAPQDNGAGPDPNKVQCEICFKFIHKNTIHRHKKNQHGNSAPVQCSHCDRMFKNETSYKDHLRHSHNIYQSNPLE